MKSKRLNAIADLINKNYSFTDIGCDHGYLAMIVRESGNRNLIICSDDKIGPLNNARRNLENYDNILFVLSDGAKEIKKQTDIAVLAGLGFQTVRKIISESLAYFRKCKKIIIQVNQNVDLLRRWLLENEFKIVDEMIILEHKYYEILVVENGKTELSEEQILFGPYLLKEKSKAFRDYYHKQIKKINLIINKLNPEHPDRIKLEEKLLKIRKMLKD